jgi:predicted DCC family thiol-disulfide oxidoreductase YuxK
MKVTTALSHGDPHAFSSHPVVLFDGVCGLCTFSIRFVLARDRKRVFRFATIQSDFGQRVYRHFGLDPDSPETFVVLSNHHVYTRSDAALEIASRLGRTWRIFLIAKLIPRPVRDLLYRVVARHRYRWFGRSETCLLPDESIRKLFLS